MLASAYLVNKENDDQLLAPLGVKKVAGLFVQMMRTTKPGYFYSEIFFVFLNTD